MPKPEVPEATAVEEGTEAIYIKDGLMRVEVDKEGESMVTIMDMKNGVMRNLMPEKKAYMEVTVEEMAKQMQSMKKAMGELGAGEMKNEADARPSQIRKTGQKKKINGFKCEQYVQTIGEKTSEYWVTDELSLKDFYGDNTKFFDTFKQMSKMGEGQNVFAIYEIDGFPILTIEKDEYGEDKTEVVKVEKKPVDSSYFEVPSGYRKVSMMEMMR